MTCKVLHDYFEAKSFCGEQLSLTSVEFVEHAKTCKECRAFAEEQSFVANELKVVRGFVPSISPSLNSAVLAGYRRYMTEDLKNKTRARWRLSLAAALPWAAALAFATIVAYGAIEYFVPHESLRSMERQSLPGDQKPGVQRIANQEPSADSQPKPNKHIVHVTSKREHPSELAAERENSVPGSFKSLVYCDPISCPGAMEVIRVQLPAPVMGLTQVSERSGGTISADVLVGADGIARGIRIVQ